MACWDIAGQVAGMPIADLMGGGSRTPRLIASSVGAKTVEETRAVIERYRQQALCVMSATEDLNVMFEQPSESLDDSAAIAGKHAAPVSVDESLVTLQDAARIASDGLAEVFGNKLNRVGGLTKAARIRDIAMFVMATGGSVLCCIWQPRSPMRIVTPFGPVRT